MGSRDDSIFSTANHKPLYSHGSVDANSTVSSTVSHDGLGPLKPAVITATTTTGPSKRLGVSAEPTMAVQNAAPVEIKYYDKDAK